MTGNFSCCEFCEGNHEAFQCPDVTNFIGLVDRVSKMSNVGIASAISHNHPVEEPTAENYSADTLAMRLIHGRHDKREIVNLIRWCLMGCPVAAK